jgi:hypothetical protein
MLHLMKLAVGITDLPHLQQVQARRARDNPPLRHLTRNHPRRAPELLDGGSIYWVIAGIMLARQHILEIVRDEAAAQTALVLDPRLVPLVGRPAKPFQGWRYLAPEAAPPDLAAATVARGVKRLPPALRRELAALGLL